jgi:hypothetical protein
MVQLNLGPNVAAEEDGCPEEHTGTKCETWRTLWKGGGRAKASCVYLCVVCVCVVCVMCVCAVCVRVCVWLVFFSGALVLLLLPLFPLIFPPAP